MASAIDSAFHDGLRFLARVQLSSGEMPVRAFREPSLTGAGELDSCVFATTFCLHALEHLRRSKIPVPPAMLVRAQRFLLKEMMGQGLFAYYTRTHSSQLPPDVDDTCCASTVLRKAHPFLMWGENVGSLLRSRDRNGAFLTWIEPFPGPNHVDVGINANVLLYLGDRSETKAASEYVRRVFGQDDPLEHTRYYPDWIVLSYLVWRAYGAGARSLSETVATAARHVGAAQRTDASFGDDVRTACALAVLTERPSELDAIRSAVELLLARQHEDGSWTSGVVYRSAEEYFGSEALTTALCLHALVASRRMLIGEKAQDAHVQMSDAELGEGDGSS